MPYHAFIQVAVFLLPFYLLVCGLISVYKIITITQPKSMNYFENVLTIRLENFRYFWRPNATRKKNILHSSTADWSHFTWRFAHGVPFECFTRLCTSAQFIVTCTVYILKIEYLHSAWEPSPPPLTPQPSPPHDPNI